MPGTSVSAFSAKGVALSVELDDRRVDRTIRVDSRFPGRRHRSTPASLGRPLGARAEYVGRPVDRPGGE
jgi:hypothetical protein